MKSQRFIQYLVALAFGLFTATAAYALDPVMANNDEVKITELQKAISNLENKISTHAMPKLPTTQTGDYVLSYHAESNSLKWTPGFSYVNQMSSATTTSVANKNNNRFFRRKN